MNAALSVSALYIYAPTPENSDLVPEFSFVGA